MDPADVDESRPFSEVRMSGSFSLLEMHNWISNAVQGVPRAPNGQTEAIVALRSCLVRSFVVCKYRQGACEVRSDNLAALAVMREALARQATAARQQVRDKDGCRLVHVHARRGLLQCHGTPKTRLPSGCYTSHEASTWYPHSLSLPFVLRLPLPVPPLPPSSLLHLICDLVLTSPLLSTPLDL